MICRFKVTLELVGPILTKSTAPGEFGVDSPFARNSRDFYYLPGTLVKGKVRQAWCGLGGHLFVLSPGERIESRIETWLGRQTGDSSPERGDYEKPNVEFEPARTNARFSDFEYLNHLDRHSVRTRIAINETSGGAEEGMMQILESPFGVGEVVQFEGTVDFFAKDAGEAAAFEKALSLGLRAVPAFGAGRGIGFGRLAAVRIVPEFERTPTPLKLSQVDSIGLILTTKDLLCMADKAVARNLFASSEVIPGSVLKGSLATTVAALGLVCPVFSAHLGRIRFRHARPARITDNGPLLLPGVLPHSIVTTSAAWYDVVKLTGAALLAGESGLEAPLFPIDWKQSNPVAQNARSHWGWPRIKRELRVRTAIDYASRRALDARLFAYEMLVPHSVAWLTRIDLEQVPRQDRANLLNELSIALAFGFQSVGKTKAHLSARADDLPDRFPTATKVSGDTVAITLQTPMLLGDPRKIQEHQSEGALLSAYREDWKERSGNSLDLSHFFARQYLSGGLYQQRRFQKKERYQPWFVTEAGSVFVFKVLDPDLANVKLDEWLKTGLPLSDGVVVGYELSVDVFERWKRCPFVPENGFGEIGVDLHLNWADKTLKERQQ